MGFLVLEEFAFNMEAILTLLQQLRSIHDLFPNYEASTFPSTLMACPVMFRPAGEQRKRHINATSSAVTMRRNEIFLRYSSRIVASSTPSTSARARITPSIRGPSTMPGNTAFTRMSLGPSSMASDLTIPTIAHLVATYGVRHCTPIRPAIDEMQMILASFDSRSIGTARCRQRYWPLRFTSIARVHSSSLMSSTPAVGPAMPAQLT